MPGIKIPLKKVEKNKILGFRKNIITKWNRYGNEGDTFKLNGVLYRIWKIRKVQLRTVERFYFKDDGFSNLRLFLEHWVKHFRNKKYNNERYVYIHFIERITKYRI
jgi:hypothetical protein